MATGISLESLSASFAYEWSPIDRKGQADATIIDAVADLVEKAAYVGASCVHLPCLEAPLPQNPADLRRIVNQFAPVLEVARERNLTICLETYWPADLARSVAEMDPYNFKVSFDVGNAVAAGRDPVR